VPLRQHEVRAKVVRLDFIARDGEIAIEDPQTILKADFDEVDWMREAQSLADFLDGAKLGFDDEREFVMGLISAAEFERETEVDCLTAIGMIKIPFPKIALYILQKDRAESPREE
jgi:hypothetical protein